MQLRMRLRALRLNSLRRSPKVPLRPPLFLQLHFLAKNIFVLRVSLRQIVESKALSELQLAAAFAVALDHQLDTPLDFGGRALPAATKILVVLDFQLADVPFELAQIFVDGGHGWTRTSLFPC